MSGRLVTIVKYLEPVEAEMIRNRLAEYGIRAMLDNYQMTQAAWYYTQAAGGIKLLVDEKDAEEANLILAELDQELEAARTLADKAASELEKQLSQSAGNETDGLEEEDDFDDEVIGEERWWEAETSEDQDSIDEAAMPWTPPEPSPIKEAKPITEPEPVPQAASPTQIGESEVEELPILNGRERLVARAFRAAVLGYFLTPCHFWASLLIVNALYDDRPLQPESAQKLRWAIWLNGFFLLAFSLLIGLIVFHRELSELQDQWYQQLRTY